MRRFAAIALAALACAVWGGSAAAYEATAGRLEGTGATVGSEGKESNPHGSAAAGGVRRLSAESDRRLQQLKQVWHELPPAVHERVAAVMVKGLHGGGPAGKRPEIEPRWDGIAACWPRLSAEVQQEVLRVARVEHSPWVGLLMLGLLFAAFFAMTRYDVPLPLAMSLVACAFLGLQPQHAESILQEGFRHYANIVILFTAVAIPAHIIERSQGFRWAAAWLGFQFGRLRLSWPRVATPLLVLVMLTATYVTAGLMHNVTSILIMTPIIIRLCDSYGVPSRWILSAALIASNLGGFSTRWGDTPNIIESATWGLSAADFMREVVPANLLVLLVLAGAATWLTQRTLSRRLASGSATLAGSPNTLQIATGAAGWKEEQQRIDVDRRLLLAGLAVLAAFIVLHVVYDERKIMIGALAILAAVLCERSPERLETLKSLGYEVYLAFAAIFVLAGCVEYSWIGSMLRKQIVATQAAPWAIAITGYLGTMFTEAASWATAASGQIYGLAQTQGLEAAQSHSAAWALGGGICAGSSSIITAASAGIILCEESGRFKDDKHRITFRRYLPFGLSFSLFMLVFYGVYFTLFRY
jgi:Na+/H+ antiporter NhaD/arsenite permease-like protein